MAIVDRPSATGPSLLGGSIAMPARDCAHGEARFAAPWTGEPGTAGTVAVVGAGKMGLPLAAQFAGHGWRVVAVDIDPAVVAAIGAGVAHVAGEPGLAERVAEAHAAGRLTATTDGAAGVAAADVVVVIVPVMLDEAARPDFGAMDAAVAAIGPGLRAGTLVVFETTLPVGTTRARFAPRLAALASLELERDLFVAFSPERLYSGAVFANLAAYPKLVGGLGAASLARAAAFYDAVLDAEVVAMSSAEAAEFSKLADTTYRDVNIALANEFARAADAFGVDVGEVIAAANSQPYSHIHQPGLGVGGHCIPVYPHFLLAGAPDLELVAAARRVNDGQVAAVVAAVAVALGGPGGAPSGLDGAPGGLDGAPSGLDGAPGGLDGAPVLVLGLTYRHGVRELAYSRGLALVEALRVAGARVLAHDPLLGDAEVATLGAEPWAWGSASRATAIVTQTGDPRWLELDWSWFPAARLVVDGRNSLRASAVPPRIAYHGIGVPDPR